VARNFLIPTADAIVLALILTPVANTLERIPSIADWAAQGPYLTLTLQRKLEGLRKSLAFMQVEQAAAATRPSPPRRPRRSSSTTIPGSASSPAPRRA
jgi:hypothetical protein